MFKMAKMLSVTGRYRKPNQETSVPQLAVSKIPIGAPPDS
jgi:hypothetical protein